MGARPLTAARIRLQLTFPFPRSIWMRNQRSVDPPFPGPPALEPGPPSRALLVGWLVGAFLLWLAAFGLAQEAAGEIASVPQADQALWVMLFRWSPVAPPILAGAWAALQLVRKGESRQLAIQSAQVALGASVVLIGLLIPKPN